MQVAGCYSIVIHHKLVSFIFQVGIAVGDIEKIQNQAYLKRLALQVSSAGTSAGWYKYYDHYKPGISLFRTFFSLLFLRGSYPTHWKDPGGVNVDTVRKTQLCYFIAFFQNVFFRQFNI